MCYKQVVKIKKLRTELLKVLTNYADAEVVLRILSADIFWKSSHCVTTKAILMRHITEHVQH